MIVEESRLQAGLVKKFLAEIGVATVEVCPTGAEALQRLVAVSPNILLSSMKLPDMSGLELAAWVRDSIRWLDAGIVLMSGDDWDSNHRSAADRLGRMELLKKPFDAGSLRGAIETAYSDVEREQRPMDGLNNLNVLIVDDSGVARRHEQETLSQLGFSRFLHADDGEIAIEQLKTTQFDLVVTDYHMPRVDGRQLIAHIRQSSSQRDVPIIMVTTEFDPLKLAAIYQLGVSAICNKSFSRDLVRNIVMQLFA